MIKNGLLMSFAKSKKIKVWSLADRQVAYTIEDPGLQHWIFGKNGTITENKLLVFVNVTRRYGTDVTSCRIYNIETGNKVRQIEYLVSPMSVLAIDNTHNFVVAWCGEKLCFISLTTHVIAKEIILNDVLKSSYYRKAITQAVFNARNDHMVVSSDYGDIICLKL